MGNSQSHGNDLPMPLFNENEYEQLKTIVGQAEQKEMTDFIPVSTELIKVFILSRFFIFYSLSFYQ